MAAERNLLTEETGATVLASVSTQEAKQPPRAFLNSARRDLSEEELKAPGAIRLLISELERMDQECAEARVINVSYHELRVTAAVLEAKSKTSKWHEVLSGLCLAIGSFGLATGQRLLATDGTKEIAISIMLVSGLLVIAGIASKVLK